MTIKPTSVYKFYSFSLLSLKTVSNDFLWFSHPSTFNDPYDCAIALNKNDRTRIDDFRLTGFANISEEDFDRTSGQVNEIKDEKIKKLCDQMKKLGVCCFTSDPLNMGMWSHYGEQHKGFCVEYDCSEGTELRKIIEEVKYSDKRVSIQDFLSNSKFELSIEDFQECWLTKAISWRQEKEWRVVKPEGGRVYRNLSQVRSIIFGARMNPDDMDLLRKCMRHKQKIKFKRASLVDDSFLLEIQDYTSH